MFSSLIIKYKMLSISLNIAPIKILQRTKLVKHIILRNFCHVTFSQKVNIQNFSFWAPNKPPFFRNDFENSYSLYFKSDQTRVTYRVSWKSVQPFSSDAGPNRQTDRQTHRQTKKNFKNVIFVFSALNYTCWYDLFLKNRKLQEIFGLRIYIYKDKVKKKIVFTLASNWFYLQIRITRGVHKVNFSLVPQLLNHLLREATACS